jgi:hypothetical protein
MNEICFICEKPMGFSNYEYYVVEQAVKPKGCAYRWKRIGVAHDECGDKYKIRFEFLEEVRRDIKKW